MTNYKIQTVKERFVNGHPDWERELQGDQHISSDFDRWLAEYTRQQREEAVKDLENGVLPEGYMIVSVHDLTDSVIRTLKEVTK